MTGHDPRVDALSDLLLDADIWDAPDRLSADECLDELGADWRRTASTHFNSEDDL
ncbi:MULTISPECIES: hypothetical protein [unclassified Brevundimonas]|uniref:hypothetical protein n=1 Tax=unclassified Brevundimonas TaxID=2622653 RepID=UPI0025C5B651|nr:MULTISPECIES: hypothetical protein [unclassified Brevundimonas]